MYQCAIIFLCTAAIMYRYHSHPQPTVMDVIGVSAVILNVLLILVWRDLLCLI